MEALAVGDVAREGLLVRDRDSLRRQLERPRVDAARAVAQLGADLAAQNHAQLLVGEGREPADRVDAGTDEPLLGARPDAGQQANRKRLEEMRLAAGPNDGEPARLAPVGRDLGDDLRVRDAERARQARARANDRLHGLGERARVVEVAARPRRGRGSPRRSRPARRSAPSRGRVTRPRGSSRGRARSAVARRRRAGSGGAPRRTTSPSGSRSRVPCSSRSRRPRGRADRRRRSAAPSSAAGSSSSSTAAKNASRSRCATIMRWRVER